MPDRVIAFVVLPKRWIVEAVAIAWLNRCRQLAIGKELLKLWKPTALGFLKRHAEGRPWLTIHYTHCNPIPSGCP